MLSSPPFQMLPPANILRIRSAPTPPLVRGGGFLSGQKAGGVVYRTYRISVGACCRAQRIFHLNDCRWQSYLNF